MFFRQLASTTSKSEKARGFDIALYFNIKQKREEKKNQNTRTRRRAGLGEAAVTLMQEKVRQRAASRRVGEASPSRAPQRPAHARHEEGTRHGPGGTGGPRRWGCGRRRKVGAEQGAHGGDAFCAAVSQPESL